MSHVKNVSGIGVKKGGNNLNDSKINNEKKSALVPVSVLIIYSVMFYAMWTVFHFFIDPWITSTFPNEAVSNLIGEGIIKNLIWTLPAVILISKYKNEVSLNLKEMLKWNRDCNKYLLLFPAFLAYIILGIVLHGGKLAVNSEFGIADIVTVLFVGVTEESVFRGWLLNSTLKRNENAAIAVNSLMFLMIHFPIWICEGVFFTNFANFGFVSIVALSVIFSLIFTKTKNIILPITLHMFWDLLIFMLY